MDLDDENHTWPASSRRSTDQPAPGVCPDVLIEKHEQRSENHRGRSEGRNRAVLKWFPLPFEELKERVLMVCLASRSAPDSVQSF
jgi:hypothetical protein